jgi:hypothetical protein
MERLTHSLAIERRAKRDVARRQYYERKRAAAAKSALELADAPANAPAPASAPAEPHKEKDILHLKTSSGNKIAKSSSSS